MRENCIAIYDNGQTTPIKSHLYLKRILPEGTVISSRIELNSFEAPGLISGIEMISYGQAKGRISHYAPYTSIFQFLIEIESLNAEDFLKLKELILARAGAKTIFMAQKNTPCSFIFGLRNDLMELKAYMKNIFVHFKRRLGLKIAA
jgi:hypothetical protein